MKMSGVIAWVHRNGNFMCFIILYVPTYNDVSIGRGLTEI